MSAVENHRGKKKKIITEYFDRARSLNRTPVLITVNNYKHRAAFNIEVARVRDSNEAFDNVKVGMYGPRGRQFD